MRLMTTTRLSPADRVKAYNTTFPDRPQLHFSQEWVTGTWAIGACYKNPNKLYGAYPHGYLDRVMSMFPDAKTILHAFSGGMKLDYVQETAPEAEMELVDLMGPTNGRYPTWQGDLTEMPKEWAGRFDLILADPPYSKSDAKKYGVKMPNRGKIARCLRNVAQNGATLVWLDTCWPMHRKDMWKTYGHIGLVRSTNHRMRLVSLFQAV